MSKETEYQIGMHDIDTSGSIADEEEVVEFEFEPEAVFKRLADDVYESAEAGIREPLMNSITAVRKAFDGHSDEGVIEFKVKEGSQTTVRIRDNGIGITKDVLNNILTVIGRSSVRDEGSLTGQYGMGFLASYKLVGADGGFLMTTNPRNSSEGPYTGLFKPGTFEPDTEGKLPSLLGEGEYGTAFEFCTKPSIDADDVFRWVKKHARWSPVPVIYRQLDESGDEVFNEDFHTGSLSDRYGDSPYVAFENEYFEVATSPEATGEAVLISSPMEIDDFSTASKYLPWDVDVRLKFENGIVVDGPHEGLAPVNRNEYSAMDDERQESYIPEGQVMDKEITLPHPIGTREKLESNEDFLEFINKKLVSEYKSVLEETLSNFNPNSDSLRDLGSQQRNVLYTFSQVFDDGGYRRFLNYTRRRKKDMTTCEKIASELNSLFKNKSFSKSDEIVQFIDLIGTEIRFIDATGDSRKERVHYVVERDSQFDEVYMCVSRSSWKYDAVQESDRNSPVVSVSKSDMYEPLAESFGWTPLKTISPSSAQSELGLTQSEVEELRGTTTGSSKVEDKMVTVHDNRSTENIRAEKIKEEFGDSIKKSHVLVMFPRGSDLNISDNRWLCSRNGICTCCSTNELTEYLSSNDSVMTYEEYKEHVLKTEVQTERGEMSLKSLMEADVKAYMYYNQNDYSEVGRKEFLKQIGDSLSSSKSWYGKGILSLVGESTVTQIDSIARMGLIDKDSFVVLGKSYRLPRDLAVSNRNPSIDEVKLYAKSALIDDVYNSELGSIVVENHEMVDSRLVSMIDSLNESYRINDGIEIKEKRKDKLPVHETKDGRMTIREIYDNHNPEDVLVAVINNEYIGYFKNKEFLEKASSNLFGLNFDGGRVNRGRFTNKTFVPVSLNEFEQIYSELRNGTQIMNCNVGAMNSRQSSGRGAGGRTRQSGQMGAPIQKFLGNQQPQSMNRNIGFNANSLNSLPASITQVDTRVVYGTVLLNDWEMEDIKDLVARHDFNQARKLVESMQPLHDSGGTSP